MFNAKPAGACSATAREGEPAPRLGEGISRTSAKDAKLFRLRIEFEKSLPMVETIKARTAAEARKFARNRYPTCTDAIVQDNKPKAPQRGLGDEVRPWQVVPCPQCDRNHRVLPPAEEGQKLDFIKCNGELIVVGLEGRWLPPVNRAQWHEA
jgi:hypothetical protein